MSVTSLEPIIRIFVESTKIEMLNFDNYLMAAEGEGYFTRDVLSQMVKIVRELRSKSDMLLYDNIALVSGALERLLDSYRDQRAETPDFDQMDQVLAGYSAFVQMEADKLSGGRAVDGSTDSVMELINSMDTGLVGFGKSPTRQPGERRRFYIASQIETFTPDEVADKESTEETGEPCETYEEEAEEGIEKKNADAKTPEEVLVTLKNKLTSYTISDDEMEELRQIAFDLDDILSCFISEENKDNQICVILSEINRSLGNWVERNRLTDLSGIVTKARIVAHENAVKQGKEVNVTLDLDEDDSEEKRICRIEKYKVGPLSRAVTHIVRNAVSHGIETPEERKAAGKDAVGNIKVGIHSIKDNGGVELYFEDDGRGFDTNAVIRRASLRGILTKPMDDYSEEEIMQLPFVSGFNQRNDRTSGASGVNAGAEASAKLIREIHGKVKIRSEKGKGTRVTIKLPYDHISDLANFL